MLVGRINKQPEQTSRFTVNFADFFDTGETIEAVTNPVITLVTTGWLGMWPPTPYWQGPPPTPPTANPGPAVALVGTYVILENIMVQIFVDSGTIGYVYQVQFIVTGTSGRKLPVEVYVQVQGP